MYTALSILLGAMLLGRFMRAMLSVTLLKKCTMGSILLLLFLLGAAIGHNSQILRNLPFIGLNSLFLMLFCVAGSVAFATAIKPFLRVGLDRRKQSGESDKEE